MTKRPFAILAVVGVIVVLAVHFRGSRADAPREAPPRPGSHIAVVNLPKLWRKPPGETAAADGPADSTDRDRSATKTTKDPFSSGRFNKRFDRTAKAVPRQYEETSFDDDPYSSLPENEPATRAAQR